MFSNNLHNFSPNRKTFSNTLNQLTHFTHASIFKHHWYNLNVIETNQIIPKHIHFIIWLVRFHKQYIYFYQSNTYKNIYFLSEWNTHLGCIGLLTRILPMFSLLELYIGEQIYVSNRDTSLQTLVTLDYVMEPKLYDT
jgi:hypothetical protein